jgi:hypothetical protein
VRPLLEGPQLVARDTKTGALVRYDAQTPDWSASDGPEEFTHWLMHQPKIRRGFGQKISGRGI